jgi:hypothetical protein
MRPPRSGPLTGQGQLGKVSLSMYSAHLLGILFDQGLPENRFLKVFGIVNQSCNFSVDIKLEKVVYNIFVIKLMNAFLKIFQQLQKYGLHFVGRPYF